MEYKIVVRNAVNELLILTVNVTHTELKVSKSNQLTKLATVNVPPVLLYRYWIAVKSSTYEKAGIISLLIKLHSVIYFSTSHKHFHSVVLVIYNFVLFIFMIVYAHMLLLKVWTVGRWHKCFWHWTLQTPNLIKIVWKNYPVRAMAMVKTNLTADGYSFTLATYLMVGYFELTVTVL